MKSILSIILTLGLGFSAAGQAPTTQNSRTLLSFLKPGDLVGVQSVDGTTSVIISTYTKDSFELAKAILDRGRATTNAKQFAAENALVRRALEQHVARQADPALVEDQLVLVPLIRTSLGTITEMGSDYVLIEFDGATKRRCVIARESIGTIYLEANPARFFGPRRVANARNS